MAKAIKVNLDLLLVQRKKKLKDLSEEVGITMANLSTLKRGKGKAIRFSTLLALCEALDCTPGDLLELEELTSEMS
ncbi:MAG: helix-turn-helix transcriptional regulator [Litorilituus sp.]|jgi:putative transcriptional regulator|nr:helix-turn-helix transcriptional regulator [Litorilituus sp.]